LALLIERRPGQEPRRTAVFRDRPRSL